MPHKLLNSVSAHEILRIMTRWNQHGYIVLLITTFAACFSFRCILFIGSVWSTFTVCRQTEHSFQRYLQWNHD